jgi:hypothetical protein
MQTFSTRASAAAILAAEAKRVIGFQLDHRPYGNAHCIECFFERSETEREGQARCHRRSLYPGHRRLAKRLDDVVGRNADMSGATLDHLQHRVQSRRSRRRSDDPLLY